MLDGPVAFRVEIGVEALVVLIQYLVGLELVEPQQPVGLIEPVFPQERRLRVQRGQAGVVRYRDISRVEHPLEAVFLVHPLGQLQNVVVRLGRRTDDHLGALAGGSELGRVAVEGQLLPALFTCHRDLLHGPEDGVAALVGGEKMEALLAGQLDVDAEAVGEVAHLLDELGAGAGDGLGMDVAAEVIFVPQQPQNGEHPLGGVVGGPQHSAGQEKSLDVVAAVELDGQFCQLPGRKSGPGNVVGLPIDAVAAVEGAAVAHQDLQQADAAAISGKGVAAARRIAAADGAALRRMGRAAGRAGYIIFCAVGQDGELVHQGLFHRKIPPRRGYLPLTPTAADQKRRGAGERLTTWPSSRPRGPRCADGSGPHP